MTAAVSSDSQFALTGGFLVTVGGSSVHVLGGQDELVAWREGIV